MLFAQRDADGHIVALYRAPQDGASEEVSTGDPEVRSFLGLGDADGQELTDWIRADLSLARVTEDLIDLLIEKGLISFTELPEAAQAKLINRRGLRNELSYVASLFGSGDGDATF